MITLQRHTVQYLTISNLFNLLFLSLALLEFYQPEVGSSNLFAEAKKKKVLVVKHVGMGYKKVPVYKKVPYKILKVEIKKKKSKKPWKKWFKKQMIVKIPHEHHHHGHHGHHHAASEGHQTWALPAFISTPSSMGEIMEAWPTDYNNNNNNNNNNVNKKDSSESSLTVGQNAAAATSSPVQSTVPAPPTSISDLKSIGSEVYPAFLAEAAAQLVQNSQFAFPPQPEMFEQQQQQQEANAERASRLRSLLSDPNELKQLLGLPSTISNLVEVAPLTQHSSSPINQAGESQQQQQAAMANNLSLSLAQPMVFSPVANVSSSSQFQPILKR